MRRRISCLFGSGLAGLFLLIIGLGLFWFGTKNLIRMWAWEKLTLKNGSEAKLRWVQPPHPALLKVYIFNVTNPEAVTEGAFPVLSEIGPYVYEEIREKVNVTEMENFTLSYRLKNSIKFDKKLSGRLAESDSVTVVNIPLAGAILSVHETVPEFVGLFNDIWQYFFPGQRNIFIKTSVRNLLFDGITIDCSSKITEVYVACRAMESKSTYSIRKEGKNFKFSFFHAKNGTSTETYQVNQGILDLKKSAQFIGMDNSSSLNKWNNEYCDMINGSDGAQFPVMLDKSEKLYVFEKDLCRSVYVEFEEEFVKNGVKLYKYSIPFSLLASSEENPENSCFCRSPLNLGQLVQDTDDYEDSAPQICFQDGVLALMPCVGSPIVASFPHFYLGDEIYVNYSGLKPDKKLHETYLHIEPSSGLAVKGVKRLQFNLEVKQIEDVEITSRLSDGLFPILWVEERIELSNDLFKLLRYTLIEKQILEWGTFVLMGVGFFLIIFAYASQIVLRKSICCFSKKVSEAGG